MKRIAPALVLLTAIFSAGPLQATPTPELPEPIYRAPYPDATATLGRRLNLDWEKIRGERRIVGAPTVEVRRNYVYVEDTDRTLSPPFDTDQELFEAFELSMREVYRVLPDEFKFLYMFTSFETGVPAYFYSPQANTDRGIGQLVFDRTGPSPLEGLVFMNYWKSFEDSFRGAPRDVIRGVSRHTFNQEAGHRWLVSLERGPGLGDGVLEGLLGRDQSHWSYFFNSTGSPMEGNFWRDNNNGSFSTRTGYNNWSFSELDLYLMGLIPAEQVQPMFVILNPNVGRAVDMWGRAPRADSPPQIFQPVTITGTRRDVTIDDFTRRLGTRTPAVGEAPTSWRGVFVMVATPGTRFSEAQKVEFEGMVDYYANGFRDGTGGRGSLDYALIDAPVPMGRPVGSACGNASECNQSEADLCMAPAGGGDICTRSCTGAGDCPADWCCKLDGTNRASICQPAEFCATPMPSVDAGVPDSGAPVMNPQPPPPATCACDTTTACDGNCACDPECMAAADCACDLTTSCDPDCTCDPECGGQSCACSSAPVLDTEESDRSPLAALALAGALALFLAGRSRRRSL